MEIKLVVSPAITFAGVQNSIPLIQDLQVENTGDQPLLDFQLRVSLTPDLLLRPVSIHVARLEPGKSFAIRHPEVTLRQEWLVGLEEAERGTVLVEAIHGDVVLSSAAVPIEILAYDEWAGQRQLPELLTAFAQPNSKAVATLLHRASELLHQQFQEALSGYQAKDRQAVARQVAAIYSAISERQIHYSNPPASFTGHGQKIRLPERIFDERLGTCLDLAMLLVSCLEQAGLNPIIFLEEGHAWVGCWLLESSLSTSTTDDRQQLRKRLDAGELLAIEATCLTPQCQGNLNLALKLGAEKLAETRTTRFELAIDVRRTRQGHKIFPLPARRAEFSELTEVSRQADPIEVVELPPLAPEVAIPESTAGEKAAASRIDQWRARLLDLTLRNKLINYKPTKQSIPLYSPDPAALEDLLADGRGLKIRPLFEVVKPEDPRSEEHHRRRTSIDFKEAAAKDAFQRSEVLAELDEKELESRLTEIFRAARTAQEEGGANTLFLAIGMLQWVESKDSERKLLAPLVMVPVTLERKTVGSGFTLRRHDDETIVNPTLLQLLESQFSLRIEGITGASELPMDDSGVDVAKIWAYFRNAVISMPGFEVRPDICIGMFSFTKYLMWKDLTDRLEDIMQSPLVQRLVNQSGEPVEESGRFPSEHELDAIKQPQDIFTPIDCDSSQLAAVNAAADGLSFVLKGPPGTGKSQTITNIIADTLARGKTVLFVSEKIAALNVVHDRLKKLGIGPFLLELHSAKATKSAVLAQLDAALGAATQRSVSEWEAEAARISSLKKDLNDYVSTLHDEHKNGLTVFAAMGRAVKRAGQEVCRFDWVDHDAHSREQVSELRGIARRLGNLAVLIKDADKNALDLIHRRDWTPGWQKDLLDAAVKLGSSLSELQTALDSASKTLGITLKCTSREELQRLSELSTVLIAFRGEFGPLLTETNYSSSVALINTLCEHGRERQKIADQLFQHYAEGLLQVDASLLSQSWLQAAGFWVLKRWLAQFRIRNLLKVYHKGGMRPAALEVPSLLDQLGALRKEDRVLEDLSGSAARILGGHWLKERSNWRLITEAGAWLSEFDQALQRLAGQDLEYLLAIRTSLSQRLSALGASFSPEGETGKSLNQFQACLAACESQITKVATLADCTFEELAGDSDRPNMAGELQQLMSRWQESGQFLRDWCQWQDIRFEAQSKGLQPFLQLLEKGEVFPEQTAAHFEYCYSNWWLDRVVDSTPMLSRFSAIDQDQKVQEFREADERFASLTRAQIHASLASRVPSTTVIAPNTPIGILKRELQKKSRHMPVRKLLGTLSGVLPRLTPCLLMSPLSVAQYLDAGATKFDLVIFDEASQIPTWDAIGAIARGKQVIVVGDPKQLPPTNFFSSSAGEGEVGEDEIEDLESILDECIGSGLSTHTLKWHYRSRRESLIAFSNYRYYASQLVTFPSPATPDNGVTFHAVSGTYQRSGARTNRQEAEEIVQFIKDHFADPTQLNRSIGVVTFSQPQQKLVEDLLDAARRADSRLDALIGAQTHEPLFVKNLENVQGDERDIILFSICYGPDETGRVFMNFGPLNREGGHRRLNVAITRAKEEVHVFSTLRPEQMDLSKTKASGVADLKLYLEFSMKGAQALLAHSAPTGLGTESPFEEQVLHYLLDEGWQVHPQVGCSNYRIDLAVVDPDAPGRYLLAVECDGATYHSAATARDRDKLRQAVLERLGWRVHRIWSTEWWTNPEREKARLKTALVAAQEALKNGALEVKVSDELSLQPPLQEAMESESPQYAKASAAISRPLIAPEYIPAELEKCNKDAFFLPSENARIQRLIREVINIEGPVSEHVIRKRICEAYGFERAGSRIQERLQDLQRGMGNSAKENGRAFFWPAEMNMEIWDGYRQAIGRDVDDIYVQELANAAKAVLQAVVVAEETAVSKLVGGVLGIQRVTAPTQRRLQDGVTRLIAQALVEDVPGGIALKT